jgi:DNA-binding NtrC family response regulator
MTRTQAVEPTIEYLPGIYLTGSIKELYAKGRSLYESNLTPLLITGETGTGKELLAKSIHYTLSPGAQFIPISCVNLPYDHFKEKIEACLADVCSDTDRQQKKPAHCDATLFFRDIGKLDPDVRQDLLGLIKKRIIEMNDGHSGREARFKLVFSCCSQSDGAAGQSLAEGSHHLVKAFHPELLSILPLRDRISDIQPLATFFTDRFAKEYGKDIGGLHSTAVERLQGWGWPGNVSELRDIIENAVLLSQHHLIMEEDIRFNVSKKFIALESFLCREDFFSLEEIEKIYIQTVLRRMKNNKSKTAKILGISRNTLQSKLEDYNALPVKPKTRKKSLTQQTLF